MPPFKDLSESQVASLVKVIRQFIIEGLREQYARQFAENRAVFQAEADQWLAARSEPGPNITTPSWTSTEELTARGRELFRSAGCGNCHVTSSEPPRTATPLFDSLGRPVTAPRLDADPLHGGDDADSIYKRLALGIPGTPHPALASTDDGDLESLVAYIQSIRRPTSDLPSNFLRAAARVGQSRSTADLSTPRAVITAP